MTVSAHAPDANTAPPITVPKLLSGRAALTAGANSGFGKAIAIIASSAKAYVQTPDV